MAQPRSRHGKEVKRRADELQVAIGLMAPVFLQSEYRKAYDEYMAATKAQSEAMQRAHKAQVELDAYRELLERTGVVK